MSTDQVAAQAFWQPRFVTDTADDGTVFARAETTSEHARRVAEESPQYERGMAAAVRTLLSDRSSFGRTRYASARLDAMAAMVLAARPLTAAAEAAAALQVGAES